MEPGIGGGFDALGVIDELKSHCGGRGFRWDRITLRRDIDQSINIDQS